MANKTLFPSFVGPLPPKADPGATATARCIDAAAPAAAARRRCRSGRRSAPAFAAGELLADHWVGLIKQIEL